MPHSTDEECEGAFLDFFDKATPSKKWMGVVFRVEGGRVLMDRTTCNFPHADMRECVNMLRRDLAMEGQLDVSPLPEASIQKSQSESFYNRPLPGVDIHPKDEDDEESDDDQYEYDGMVE